MTNVAFTDEWEEVLISRTSGCEAFSLGEQKVGNG